ncbi:MAG: MAPEG family protein [Hyphomicrobium sp.]
MPITALYAALLAPLLIFLSARVIGRRREAKVTLGPGEDALLLRRMRVQANFAEYVPFALLSLALAETVGTSALVLHLIGATLLAGRYVHAYGVSQSPENFTLRIAGMVATFVAIGAAAGACLVHALPKLPAL